MAACVGALTVREVALCVIGGHFFAVTLYPRQAAQGPRPRRWEDRVRERRWGRAAAKPERPPATETTLTA